MVNFKQKLEKLLATTASQGASDLHISVGKKPTIRLDANLIAIEQEEIIDPESAEGLVMAILDTEERQAKFRKEKETDFSFSYKENTRFRANAYYQKGNPAAALRLIPAEIRTIEQLELPELLHDFTKLNQGFILLVGPAGHGKSTTLAAILDEINHTRSEHIITIEDPIEYMFSQDRSIVSQREVGNDTASFHNSLRAILRQDPDVVMIGEMRDSESISTAMTAAETGHLVFATLHTNSASQTIDRIIDTFPAAQQTQAVSQLAATLVAIISQRLIPKIDGGRVPAAEIMLVNSAIRNLIRERKTYQIDVVIETNLQEGMITLNRSLANLVREKQVSLETAQLYSTNPAELRLMLNKG
ncbi:MAG: type IV pili twitching motility protein PilT [Candidatus Harrisonbacteria bacterium CG10_big_fil_rev_8_21_14_0_10_45_28]|uniref:Type IV pili twitching motility protein PilT n=1 Tax=Candidatus Harrisonbacteria bacterium CG10_big_fil_rev_8_21_14_0_10_45_28 TaxID=1974586 RepID=A0A2H0UNL2_9BACT|nr:MAG: type IV pili twitching motility protein PilT [Candidatus Harrisonbacteria bacterium CG10_big_fil_rev_8_21_14_0_10_45_28]